MSPKVSVIITTYNQADTIGEALESVINQKCAFDYEIIIGEDASTDGTRAVCEQYAARFPEMIRLMPKAPNKGLIDNFYDCIEAARGEYITDCAGDDTWISDRKLELMARLLDTNPDANVVFSDWMIHNVSTGESHLASALGNNLLGRNAIVPGDLILKSTLNHIDSLPYNLSASMYRRADVISALGSSPDMVRNRDFGCEDLPLIAALATRGGGIYLDIPTLRYNIRDNSISNNSDILKLIGFHSRTLHACAALGKSYGMEQTEMNELFTSKSDYMIALAFESENPDVRDSVIRTLQEWNLPLSLKASLRIMLMKRPLLWKSAGRTFKRLHSKLRRK